jgi:hypothetical protein
MFQAMQGRVERPLLHAKQVVADLIDALRDRPPVKRPERDGAHDEEVQGALEYIGLVAHGRLL